MKEMDDGCQMIGNMIEYHSVHVDNPFAYGYNEIVKDEYYRSYGKSSEQNMDIKKIAKVGGDVSLKSSSKELEGSGLEEKKCL